MSNTLRIPENLGGVGASTEQAIHQDWDTYSSVVRELEMKYGFPAPKEPDFNAPTLSVEDLTEAQGREYTEKYLHFTSWFNYTSQVVAYHQAKLLQLENEMKQIEAKMREGMRERSSRTTKGGEKKPPPLAEMADIIRLDPRYTELGQQRQWHEQVLYISRTNAAAYESSVKLISRQIEIKRMEFEQASRENNLNGRQGGARPLRTPSNRDYNT